jgi:hypothetical protein
VGAGNPAVGGAAAGARTLGTAGAAPTADSYAVLKRRADAEVRGWWG